MRGDGVKHIQFTETLHGPILDSNLVGASKFSSFLPKTGEPYLSFCWSVYAFRDASPELLTKINTASDVSAAREAFSHVTSAGLAMLVATVSGDIYFQSTGRLPIRAGLGDLPLPGWIVSNTWQGYVPYEEMPFSINPEKGYIVVANNYPVGTDYKYFSSIGRYNSQGRAERITELIQKQIDSGVKFTAKDQLVFQMDELNILARSGTPTMLKKVRVVEKYRQVYREMQEWDFVMGKDSRAAAVYSVWMRNIARKLLESRVTPEILEAFLKSLVMQLAQYAYFEEWYPSIEELCNNPKTNITETCEDLITESFNEACDYVGDSLWGDIHYIVPESIPFSKIPIISRLYEMKQRVGGNYQTVHAMHITSSEHFHSNHGPGCSMVMDLGNEAENYWKIETGVSGNPFSKHFNDMFSFFHSEKSIRWVYRSNNS